MEVISPNREATIDLPYKCFPIREYLCSSLIVSVFLRTLSKSLSHIAIIGNQGRITAGGILCNG